MPDVEFAQRQILKYRAAIERDREELARLAEGQRHFDQAPGAGIVETTEQRRGERLAHIELLRELIRLWGRELSR